MQRTAECIAFANHKGGTGKTTSCLSIAGYLAKNGKRVLVVDFDPQASATSGLGIDVTSVSSSIYDTVLAHCDGYTGLPITRVILETDVENLHVVPSELDLAVAEVMMQRSKKKTSILKRILADVTPFYDYILIDLPPNSGMLTINGLYASDQVVVPLEPSIFSLEALENLKIILADVKRMTGHSMNRVTVILNRYPVHDIFSRIFFKRSPSREVMTRLKQNFDTVLIVPGSRQIYLTQQRGIPISHFASESRVGKAYEKIAESISDNTN